MAKFFCAVMTLAFINLPCLVLPPSHEKVYNSKPIDAKARRIIKEFMMAIFQKNYKVYINHTDAGGIVYHANHLTFFENCRRDWLASLGYDGYFFDLSKDGDSAANTHGQGGAVHFVVSQAELKYIAPLLVDDELSVTVDSLTIKPASLILSQSIYRPDSDKPATTGMITLACVRNDGKAIRPYRLPQKFADLMKSLV
ncbi:acyl-CoA thioesterase [Moraxella sp. FZFQ2102]|uniref:acyl-CoA thioesterase n=1 Tax=Moraxella sp. FZFQ2102 TaxID=2953752 RepID=UPI00209C50AC|nr:thioesterase family protein [Moraxella sp. FZFQ2102]USZ14795.1 acyl-CoA thioesterase [Moraxella sp. FZFQ2102]